MNDAEPLKVSVRIQAAPAVVFPYLIDSSLIIQWIGTRADLDPEPGGTFAIDINGTQVRGQFVLVEPPNRVVFTWGVAHDDELPEGSTTVEIVLRADGPDTIVELTHRGLTREQSRSHRSGWIEHLEVLRVSSGSTPSD